MRSALSRIFILSILLFSVIASSHALAVSIAGPETGSTSSKSGSPGENTGITSTPLSPTVNSAKSTTGALPAPSQTTNSTLPKAKSNPSTTQPNINAKAKIAQDKVNCDFEKPEKSDYSAQFLTVRSKPVAAKNELFETKVFIANTGNVPWFSADSGCKNNIVNLGTEYSRDRNSPFYPKDLIWESNWANANRIKLDKVRVDAGAVATFTFWSQAPDEDGLYREYYSPLMEGVTWMEGGLFSHDVSVGTTNMDPATKDLLAMVQHSGNLSKFDLKGEKQIEIDLSEQKMYIKLGDQILHTFVVSTGKKSTPTPVGENYKILSKQNVRVASAKPHYIMPKFMMFKAGGFGIHALPSLANDHGVFWREALNHIGTPRSHGCVRLLPKDADLVYSFADVGTRVVVKR